MDRTVARFEGLADLDRALGIANRNLQAGLREELRHIADEVADEAQRIASQKDLRRSGDLIRKIRPFAAGGRAGVRSGAIHRGYPYPRRLEFESRGSNTYGPRATLLPALDAKTPDVQAGAERLLDRFADDFART